VTSISNTSVQYVDGSAGSDSFSRAPQRGSTRAGPLPGRAVCIDVVLAIKTDCVRKGNDGVPES
jgi:hypothetical protein